MRNSSIINFIRIIYVAVPTRAILIAFLPRRIINYKYQSQQQKKNSNKLIIPLLIITCHSIFEVSAVTNYLSNQEFDGKRSQSIIVNQSTDEFKVINCSFRNCWNGASGGALNIRLSNGGKCWILNTTFTNCNTTLDGGAIYANISSGAELTIDGLCLFTDCHAQWSGGGVYARIDGQSSKLLLEDYLKFERCSCIQGGGTSIENSNNGSCNINKVSCIDCGGRNLGGGIYVGSISEEIQKLNGTVLERCHADMGGGLEISLSYGNPSVELISITCIECRASNCGGGLVIAADQGIQVIMHGQCSIQNCSSYYGYYGEDVTQGYCTGGGMECFVLEQCFVEINNASFKNCFAYTEGGGLLAYIQSGGKLIIDQSSFYKCKCNEGNGGGIYTLIDFVTQCKFIIKDTLIQGCKALNNTNSSLRYPESGYGGGIFLTGSGDYDPSTNLIDLRGMKIYNNTADKYGQSLYVAMTKVVEWCKYGILGEYVKGNYSDGISNKNELIGIPVKYDIFNSRTQAQIIEQQKPLECWWMFGILKSAQVVVNVSNPDGKLIFHLEGQRLTPGYLNVKIFELRDKTQEEIDQEQKQIKSNLNNINLNFSKENSPNNSKSYKHQIINNNQIIIGKQKQQQEQSINESSNSIFIPINSFPSSPNDNKLLQTESNEIIYPPKDGSSSPIQIEGEIENEQKASFGMDEYEWLNYKQKLYGVLISNDGEVFTGLNGSVNSAVPLKITIEEEGQQEEEAQELEQDIAPDTKEGYQFPYWGIILIVVSVLIIASIIMSCFCCWLYFQKSKQKKIKQLQEMTQLQNQNENSELVNGLNEQQSNNNNNLVDESINYTSDQQQSDLNIGMPTLIKDKIVSEEQEQTIDDGFDNHKQNKQFIIGEPVLIKDKIISEEDIEEEQENNQQNNNKRDEQKMNKQILNIGEPILIKDKEVKEENEKEEIVKQKKNEKEHKDQLIIGNPILIKDKIVYEEDEENVEIKKENEQIRNDKQNKDQFQIGNPILTKDKEIIEQDDMNENKTDKSKEIQQQKIEIKQKENEQIRNDKQNKDRFMIGEPVLTKDKEINDKEIDQQNEQEKESHQKIKYKENKDQFDIGKPILIKDKLIREEVNMNEKQNENKDDIRQKRDMKEQDEEKKKEKEKKNHHERKQKENKENFMICDPLQVKDIYISKNEEDIEIKKEDEQKKETNIKKKEKEGNKHQNKENKKNNEDLNRK